MSESEGQCCTSAPETERDNPPGRSELRYRVGTHSSFLARMLAQLSKQIIPPNGDPVTGARPLADLRTRSTDDETIALLDAWACALDVLTFYDERYVQEGFLPTATLRESVFALAKSIGYSPSPGVAASTTLAFKIDDSAGGPTRVTIPLGSSALSIPTSAPALDRPIEAMRPQTFETIETIEARPDWNLLRATSTKPMVLDRETRVLYLQGIATRLSVGDALLIVGKQRSEGSGENLSERWDLRMVNTVEIDSIRAWTKVTLDRKLGDPRTLPADIDVQVFAFRERGSLFGHDAPDFRAMSDPIKLAYGGVVSVDPLVHRNQWPNFSMAQDATTKTWLAKNPARGVIDLDREYAKLTQGTWVCLQDRAEVEAYRVEQVSPTSRTDFTLTAKGTRVALDGYEHLTRFNRRSTVVHLQSEALVLLGQPDTAIVKDQEVRIAGNPSPMPPGRMVVVRGRDVTTDELLAERAIVRTWTVGTGYVDVRFEAELVNEYYRDSFELLGNVAAATHGSTVREAIGSGDASASNQRFALLQAPLTWVVASTASGRESTLELTIDNVRWTRVDALLDAEPGDRVYQLDVDSEGHTQVILGDGHHGARAPTGLENVRASYRKGIGLEGEVATGQIGLMISGPAGVRAVSNPLPALGAEDPESLDQARRNAPMTVLTLDRLVSVSDYGDFARTFAGIGKAKSTALWTGKRSVVHLTVASASGTELSETDPPITALREALASKADPSQMAMVSTFELAEFAVHLRIIRDPAWLEDPLDAAIALALIEQFSFERREFAQTVAASEVVAVVQAIPGVVALDLDKLHRVGQPAVFNARLPAARASWSGYGVERAELLLVSGNHITIDWIES